MSWCWSFILSVWIEPRLLPVNIEHSGLWSVTMVILLGDPAVTSLNLRRQKSMFIAFKSNCGYRDSAWDIVLDAKATGLAKVMSSSWASMAPSPVMCASTKLKVGFVMLKYRNSTSCQNSFSNAREYSSCSFFHSNFVFDLDSSRNTADFLEKFAMNSELDCIIHRKLINSSFLVGDEKWSNAST